MIIKAVLCYLSAQASWFTVESQALEVLSDSWLQWRVVWSDSSSHLRVEESENNDKF